MFATSSHVGLPAHGIFTGPRSVNIIVYDVADRALNFVRRAAASN